ncbi:hypothetical protein, partial [Lactobacillus selangorensis]|uniref:hypothetical protein n=1 Tax=Lactobacillus selangorensis TaxID=81857 RepID=UPI001F29B34A
VKVRLNFKRQFITCRTLILNVFQGAAHSAELTFPDEQQALVASKSSSCSLATRTLSHSDSKRASSDCRFHLVNFSLNVSRA